MSERTTLDPLWTKSPFVLRRFPGLAAALALGAMLLVLAMSAYPLFISASESGLLAAQIDAPTITRYGAGVFYSRTSTKLTAPGIRQALLIDEMGDVFDRETSKSPLLESTIRYIFGPTVSVSTPDQPVPAT